MAATTKYGGAPLPEVAPREEKLEALRGVEGGWMRQQHKTQRWALLGATAFCVMGLAVLALVTSPSYREWEEGYGDDASGVANFGGLDGVVDDRGGVVDEGGAVKKKGDKLVVDDDAAHAHARRDGGAPGRGSRHKDVSALGETEAPKIWKEFAEALPEPQLLRLRALLAASRVMPDEMFTSYTQLAQSTLAGKEEEEKGGDLVTKLSTMTVMDADTARLMAHFTTKDEDNDDDDSTGYTTGKQSDDNDNDAAAASQSHPSGKLAARFVTRVLPLLRKYPDWDYTDGNAVRLAARRAAASAKTAKPPETKSSSMPVAELGDAASSSASSVIPRRRTKDSAWKRKASVTPTATSPSEPLNGITRRSENVAAAPLPVSEFASAPGFFVRLGEARTNKKSTTATAKADDNDHSRLGRIDDGGAAGWGEPDVGAVYDPEAIIASFDPESVGLPKNFDAREEWPKCAHILGTVRDQGKCGSCWAVSTVEVMNDRLCVKSKGKETRELSPQFPLSCFASGNGCDGGNVEDTINEAQVKGVPLGGILRESRKECLPYEFEPCDHPCQVPGTTPQQCPSRCANNEEKMELVYPHSGAYTCPPGDWACIAKEIHKYGSVAVTFGSVYSDFYKYESGVYRVSDKDKATRWGLGEHATKLIGWGIDEETNDPYWLMMNSWQNWGDHGAGRVGVGEMNIESGIAMMKM